MARNACREGVEEIVMDKYYIQYCQSAPVRATLDGHIPQVGDYVANGDVVAAWDCRAPLVDAAWVPDLDALMDLICSELSPNRAVPVKWGTALLKLSVWMTEQNAASLLASCMQEVLLRYLVSLRQPAVEFIPLKRLTRAKT